MQMLEAPQIGLRLLKMLLVLLLGGRAPEGPAPAGVDLSALAPAGAPVCVELDLGRIREIVAGSAEVAELVFEGKDPQAASLEAAAAVGLLIGARTESVSAAFAGLRRAGVWLVAFGERAYQFRVLALVDTGGARDLLAGLLAGADRLPGYHRTEYAGATVHGFAMGGGHGVWCAESNGAVAVALDPLEVERFLLRAASRAGQGAPPAPTPAGERAAVEAEADCRAFLDMLMLALGRGDRGAFLAASAVLDFPSWKRATATYDGTRLAARLELDPRSPVLAALRQPAGPPGLLAAVPEGCGLALVGGVGDARAGWDFARSAVGFAARLARPGAGLDLAGELTRATGLDGGDLFENLVAGAYVVPVLERPRDLVQRGILLLEVRDAAAAEGAIEMFAAATDGRDVDVRVQGDATVWRGRGGEGGIAVRGTTVVVAPGRDSPLEAVLRSLGGPESGLARSLRRLYPGATAFATVDLSGLREAGPLAGLGRRSVGLSLLEGVLAAEADVPVPEIAKAIVGAAAEARARAARERCLLELRRVYVAAYRHAAAKGGFPGRLDDMREHLRGGTGECALSGKPLVYRSELAGKRATDFPNRADVVVAHDPPGAHPDGGCVVRLNGRAEWLEGDSFRELVAELDRKAREERVEEEQEREDEPVF